MIRFYCPCGRLIKVSPAAAGRRIRCPFCGKELRAPKAEPSARGLAESPAGLPSVARRAKEGGSAEPSARGIAAPPAPPVHTDPFGANEGLRDLARAVQGAPRKWSPRKQSSRQGPSHAPRGRTAPAAARGKIGPARPASVPVLSRRHSAAHSRTAPIVIGLVVAVLLIGLLFGLAMI